MKPQLKFWVFLSAIIVTVFGVILASFVGSWMSLEDLEQEVILQLSEKLLPFPLLGALILCGILGFLVSLLFHYYIIPLLQLSESTRLISAVNPNHRIQIRKGAREIHSLTSIINESAEAFAKLQQDVDLQIRQSQAQLNEERTRLAALMSELPHGVVVCNTEGQVLLYNPQAQNLFCHRSEIGEVEQPCGILGLGRSLFSLLDRDPIVHALALLRRNFVAGQNRPVSNFMMTLRNGLCLRVKMAPVLLEQEGAETITGFVLTLEDMTEQIAIDTRRDQLIQSLTDDLQVSLLKIRNSITTIQSQPRLDYAQLQQYREIINQASKTLQEKIELARLNYAHHLRDLSQTEDILASDLLEIIAKNIHDRYGFLVNIRADDGLWLQLNSYLLVQAISHLATLLKGRESTIEMLITLNRNAQEEIELAINWPEEEVESDLLDEWQQTPLTTDSHGKLMNLQDFIGQMGGTIKPLRYLEQRSGVMLTFPGTQREPHLPQQTSRTQRPISYEFDLFNRRDWQELGQVPLRKLTYVVFDTETTGLHPTEGDEIIQLGAIRIVNGQLLYHETIDQLIDPHRPVPASSVAIHGISQEMLEGQPAIDQILPHFKAFAENSVLVAHNAAFDMRFLELKEKNTGVHFDNPVLDTLLLSSVLHPHQESHALEEIAERLNVTIVGRHTALGDAIVTGEVLTKMIPLLEAQGIHNLEQALTASAQSRFTKLHY